MANVDKQEFLWNWKLKWDMNKIYTDIINVDVVKPPYSWGPRNTSFFLQTRLWYIAEKEIQTYVYNHTKDNENRWLNYKVTDVEVIWKDNCTNREWTVAVLIYNEDETELMAIWAPIKEMDKDHPCVITGCFKSFFDNSIWEDWIWKIPRDWDTWCFNPKIFKTTAAVGKKPLNEVIDWRWPTNLYDWIQENRVEWWVTIWYFTTERILNSDWDYKWANWLEWKYIVVEKTFDSILSSSDNADSYWIAWQTRMIIWYTDDHKYLVLDDAWDWLKINGKWYRCLWNVYEDEWEVFWLNVWMRILIMPWYDNAECWEDLTQQVTEYTPVRWNIVSTVDCNGRLYSLYDNWWVHCSQNWWRDKFFYSDDVFVWEDKIALCSYMDCVIAFWRNKTSVIIPTIFEWDYYFNAYEQSATIWLKSRYAFWEHDWALLFASNDNRLFKITPSTTTGKYMLEIKDVWVDFINSKLSLTYDSDEVFIWEYWNELKIFVQSKPNPSKPNSNNSETHIYKYDSIYQVYTEDHLENILISWYKYWVYFWDWWIYVRWLVEQDWSWYVITDNGRDWIARDFRINPEVVDLIDPPESYRTSNKVVANIAAYMTENETNWITHAYNWSSTWAPDLFSMIKLNRLATTLWYWKYSEQTKIKITAYREWIWEVTEIPIPSTNAWIEMVTGSYLQKPVNPDILETKRCLLETIGEWQTKYIQDWEFVERKVEDLINDSPRCESTKRINYQNHNIDIDSSIYELAPHKPIVIWWLSDTQHYSSQVRVEIISESWDILSFGWFLAELYIAPNFFQWADWENLIEMGSC